MLQTSIRFHIVETASSLARTTMDLPAGCTVRELLSNFPGAAWDQTRAWLCVEPGTYWLPLGLEQDVATFGPLTCINHGSSPVNTPNLSRAPSPTAILLPEEPFTQKAVKDLAPESCLELALPDGRSMIIDIESLTSFIASERGKDNVVACKGIRFLLLDSQKSSAVDAKNRKDRLDRAQSAPGFLSPIYFPRKADRAFLCGFRTFTGLKYLELFAAAFGARVHEGSACTGHELAPLIQSTFRPGAQVTAVELEEYVVFNKHRQSLSTEAPTMFTWAASRLVTRPVHQQSIDMLDLEYLSDYLSDDGSTAGDPADSASAWINIIPATKRSSSAGSQLASSTSSSSSSDAVHRRAASPSPMTPTIPPTIPNSAGSRNRRFSGLPAAGARSRPPNSNLHPVLLALRLAELRSRNLDKLRFRIAKTRAASVGCAGGGPDPVAVNAR
ncbi:hypothetical protein HDU88_008895 [Geranomyces variabilis]|nr:hypothetical protein HDU88_008895 [Geranomyces variabilis]